MPKKDDGPQLCSMDHPNCAEFATSIGGISLTVKKTCIIRKVDGTAPIYFYVYIYIYIGVPCKEVKFLLTDSHVARS